MAICDMWFDEFLKEKTGNIGGDHEFLPRFAWWVDGLKSVAGDPGEVWFEALEMFDVGHICGDYNVRSGFGMSFSS